MKKKLIFFVVLALIVVIALIIFSEKKEDDPLADNHSYNLEESREIAENWMNNNSITYVYDGFDLELKSEKEVVKDLVYSFTYSFKSQSAGYGDRDGEMSAQVISPHSTEIIVESGEIISAITDDVYDEINDEMLEVESDEAIDEVIIE